MENILSTLKGEYARTLILILIPGAIAFEPFFIILYKYFNYHIDELKDYTVIIALVYILMSLFIGFILQDIGARIEILLDTIYCHYNPAEKSIFNSTFELYLFNERQEDFIITHYYRSMLVRMKFELHGSCALIFLLLGSLLKVFFTPNFLISWTKTICFASISTLIISYMLYEAYKGVEALHSFRIKINNKFKPTLV